MYMNERIEQFMRFFPATSELLQMEPEELGPFVLRYMTKQGAMTNRFNFFQSVPNEVARPMAEAWGWLEREGLIALKATDQFGLDFFITRKGMTVVNEEDFSAYLKAAIFPSDLDPVLMRAVKPLFLRGDYDTAVFRAFKEVEVRVRRYSGLGNEHYGYKLMQRAFGPNGKLHNPEAGDGVRELFGGAISFCKNPSSHREVQFENPREVVDMISFANQLLRIVERLAKPSTQ
jgi:uncharacterized protein (TIGR02391 family)